MSSTINIYEANATDFDCEGLGTLCPLEWEYVNKGVGGAILSITHPYDPDGKWQLLQAGRIIRADVPVRTVPEIQAGALVATAEQWTVSTGATKNQRYMWTKSLSGKGRKKKCVPKGTVVTVVLKGVDRYKIKHSKYGTGWMDHDALEVKIQDVPYNTVAAVEAATPSVQVRAQLFRLQQPKRKLKEIEVEAMPVAYDAAGILTDAFSKDVLTGPQALALIKDNAYMDSDVELYTDIGDSRTAFDKRNANIIGALLDGDESFVGRYGGDVLLDDWEITILRSAGMDRGFYATYGRNLTGIDSYEISDDITTCILPVGETEKGEPLYLDGDVPYITSPNFDQFPLPHMAELKVSEAKVNKKEGVTVALARTRMRNAVQAEWDKGVHIPAVTLKIDYARLGDSEEYKAFKDMDQCHMYDIVHVWHPLVCGYLDMAVCECTWDGMKGRYTETTLGTPGGTLSKAKISAGSISGSISGKQIGWGALSAGQLANDCIEARHIQAESVNADAIQAESLTAETAVVQQLNAMSLQALTAKLNSVTAQTIVTDTLAASVANLMHVAAQDIEAGRISTDVLAAVLAEMVTVQAKVGSFDLSTVQNLVSSALTLQRGQANSMYITNLAVTSANLLNVTVGKLVIKGDDNLYYEVGVGANGVIRTSQYDATAAEIAAGVTTDGRQIVEETINAQTITGKYVSAEEATFNRVLAAALEAGKITASEALLASASIPMLYVTSIKSLGDTIDISANESIRLQAGRLNSMALLDDEGLHVGRAVLDEDGNYQTDADGNPVFSTKEVLIREESVDIRQSGQTFSRFAGDYAQFGNYQMRKSTDGGLVFKMKEE